LLDERRTSRWTTSPGKWLQTHPLDAADCESLTLAAVEHNLLLPDYVRAVLRQWKTLDPSATAPVEAWMWSLESFPPPASKDSGLADSVATLATLAATDAAPLRRYARLAMAAYRERRSVFYAVREPGLENALRRLVETDRHHLRVHRLHLAEMAWDRGDDPQFLELARLALDPDTSRAGPAVFTQDPRAPQEVLWRWIEHHSRLGEIANAKALAEQARTSGFAGAGTTSRHPVLELMIRKIERWPR
jgi:hypothetical protein